MRGLLDRILRNLILTGRLTVRFPDGRLASYGPDSAPVAGVSIATWRTVRGLLANPSFAFGQAYVARELEPLDCSLQELLDLLFLNVKAGGRHPGLALRRALARGLRGFTQHIPLNRARDNSRHHYDLNGRLYSLFLDRDKQYSCAYFARGDETLEQAQAAKKRHIAAKLLLDRPGLEVLDIGCGWGGMAITLARDYHARVTGITLSTEQLQEARARAAAEGLSNRVHFEMLDYRTVLGRFDRIVSIGMFEHVGLSHYHEFFAAIRRLLRRDGIALIHAIGRSEGPGVTNPWLARHVFPGGYAPALSEVFAAVEQSELVATDCEILRLHYAETIRHWRRRFAANRDAIAALYDERFCRMFDLYLTGAELTFRRLGHVVWQMQLAARQDAVPLTREYLAADTGLVPARLGPRQGPPSLSRD